jgi:hypothetical protein
MELNGCLEGVDADWEALGRRGVVVVVSREVCGWERDDLAGRV